MENGSSPRSAVPGDPARNGRLPLSARVLGVGVRGVRGVGRATGIDRAVEVAAEEAIVAAIESEAVERAMARVLQGPVVEDAVQGALESDAVKRALLEAMDSELVDEVWRRLLASEETQQLIERIAGAPELRAAISAQGVGLLEDIGRTIGRIARGLDARFERVARAIFRRPSRTGPSDHAGAISRALATLVDGVLVNLSFSAVAAIAALVNTAFGGVNNGLSGIQVAVGSTIWLALGAVYLLIFWSLEGQTPGMRFLGIRLSERRLPLRRAVRRLVGLALSVVTFGIGFLGIVFRDDRRGWGDRLADLDVVYDEPRPAPAPWAVETPAEPAVPVGAPPS
jgi:uncharacterized RDD family membrane protein YckC